MFSVVGVVRGTSKKSCWVGWQCFAFGLSKIEFYELDDTNTQNREEILGRPDWITSDVLFAISMKKRGPNGWNGDAIPRKDGENQSTVRDREYNLTIHPIKCMESNFPVLFCDILPQIGFANTCPRSLTIPPNSINECRCGTGKLFRPRHVAFLFRTRNKALDKTDTVMSILATTTTSQPRQQPKSKRRAK